jgi:hypothetical protein
MTHSAIQRVLSVTILMALVTLTACSQPAQVEGVKYTASPTSESEAAGAATTDDSLQPTADGGLAVRLLPPTSQGVVGEPVELLLEYADAHGGLVGTVEDFGDGGIGGLKVSDCRDSEQNPSRGDKRLTHTWSEPGTYKVTVTVTTLSCVHGQEDVTATAQVVVK